MRSVVASHEATETDSTSAALGTPLGGRVQLALNVSDVDAAVQFYAMLFGVPPTKRRPGYANFAITTPPLKLVLIEDPGARGTGVTGALNHLGVEVPSSAEVGAATARLTGQGLATLAQDATSCCYAVQDKVWVHDPDGAPWEVYTVLADAPHGITADGSGCATVDGQCVPTATGTAVPDAPPSDAAPESACCDATSAESCCDASAKPSCCGDTTGGLPSSCGCS